MFLQTTELSDLNIIQQRTDSIDHEMGLEIRATNFSLHRHYCFVTKIVVLQLN